MVTLLLNDHYLKYAFSNWLTGKLSDVVGIIVLPLLLAFIFPKLKKYSVWMSALLFAFWKSPFSQSLIDLYNQIAFIQTSRIVDFTDMYVLLLLPVPYFIIYRIDQLEFLKIHKVNTLFILLLTVATLMATSPPPSHYYTRTEGNLACYRCNMTVNYNQDEIVQRLKEVNIVFDRITPIDSVVLERVPSLKKENVHVYRLNQLVIDKDTLRNLDFTMRAIKDGKTKIYFNGMQVSDDISTMKLEIKLRNYYKKLLFEALKNKLRK
ncbi:MAG: hypothetical protein ACKO96_48695 [Flammeovirgaceae bacterium]